MTTETDIQEIARRLGWEYDVWPSDGATELTDEGSKKIYTDPETNADLHMRWMVEHGINVVVNNAGEWFASATGIPLPYYPEKGESTPHEAIRAALIAKLRSEQDA
jgi:hypothetical protein